jgi:hypothetical protein
VETNDQGTHKSMVRPTFDDSAPHHPMEEPGAVVLETEPGDCIIFTESLRHGGMPVGRSEGTRRSIHVGYGPFVSDDALYLLFLYYATRSYLGVMVRKVTIRLLRNVVLLGSNTKHSTLSACLPVCLPVCPPVCLSVCLSACLLSVCLSACLPACLSVCLHVCLSAVADVSGANPRFHFGASFS